MDNLELIWKFQQTMRQQKDIERQLKQSESVRKLKELKIEIEGMQQRIRGVLAESNEQKKELRNIEDNLVSIKEKIKRANDELYGGKLHTRELDAVEKSIAVLNGKAVAEEENALNVMDKLEELNKRVHTLKEQLEGKKMEFKTLNKAYSDGKDVLLTKLQETNAAREKLMNEIDPTSLDAYRIFSERFPDNFGIALLENGICSGCHMGISFEKMKISRNSNDIVTCDNCGRWLLFK